MCRRRTGKFSATILATNELRSACATALTHRAIIRFSFDIPSMPKRKYHEISTSGLASSTKLSAKQQRQQESLRGHLDNAQTQLVPALKLARGFERQKLGRRQKDARGKEEQENKSKDGARIDAEIKALKALDLSKAAEFYTLRTLCRIKTIASSPVMPPDFLQKGSAPSPYRDSATTNVTARLFKSMAVRRAMEAIEAEARKIVTSTEQPSEPAQVSDAEQEIMKENKFDDIVSRDSEQFENDSENNSQELSRKEIRDLRSRQNLDQDDVISQMDEDDAFEARLASDSEPGSSPDDEDISGDENIVARSLHQTNAQDTMVSQSPPTKSKQTLSKPSTVAFKPLKSTTFLPTLASGYVSGSDSGSYQSDDETATKTPKRRNRMGQQARRALAEQQYGSAANHLKNSKGNKKSKQRGTRDTGWDLKKGAVDGGRRGYGTKDNLKPNIASNPSKESNGQKLKVRAKDDTGQLHPSWIAKKKIKEQQKQGISVYQGKKMTFD